MSDLGYCCYNENDGDSDSDGGGLAAAALFSFGLFCLQVQTSPLCLLQVSSLFKDGTIGGNINIVIVGLVLLDEEQVSTSQL